ncbi:MAG: response regulator [Bacteroidota bacterium]
MQKEKIILLVDDDASILNATKAGLVARGFNVQAAEGADAAMHALQSLEPSIIVSDLVMPGTNGFELFQRVKKETSYQSVPFVFLTAVDDYHAQKFGKELGSAAYITKPVDLDELVQIIKDRLGE